MPVPPQWTKCKYCGKDIPESRMLRHMDLRHAEEMQFEAQEAYRLDVIERIDEQTGI
jgi:hypothetical protein